MSFDTRRINDPGVELDSRRDLIPLLYGSRATVTLWSDGAMIHTNVSVTMLSYADPEFLSVLRSALCDVSHH